MPYTEVETDRVILAVENNRGYSEDQIDNSMTLRDLLRAVEDAIAKYGEDVMVVTCDSGNRYGANYGAISVYEDTFLAPAEIEDGDR